MDLSSVTVEMAVRRALESDGGGPVVDVEQIALSSLPSAEISGFEATRSRLLEEYAASQRISVAAAAMRLGFTAALVRYARFHH